MQLGWQKNCKFLLAICYLLLASFAHAQSSVLDLNEEIQQRKQQQSELQGRINEYNNKIRAAQRKAASLNNQIQILDSNIRKTDLEIKTKELEAEQLALETQLVARQIQEEENRMGDTREDIAHVLRAIKRFDDRKYLEIVLAERSFSEVFDQLFYAERLARSLSQKLETFKVIRELLERNKILLEEKQQEAKNTAEELSILVDSFTNEKQIKRALFGETQTTEAEFQQLLTELRAAAAAIDSEIVTLEKSIRERLDLADKLAGDTGLLSWPVSPIGGITAAFHDPDYPFRYLFEHGGIDIRARQGTAVRAAASGYVAKIYNGGLGIRPSYVMLLHGNSMSTVYMHLSQIAVAPEIFVARGDIIGYSGGTPGTSGAGRWSTGPHLHFETRINGVPVDPVGYLP